MSIEISNFGVAKDGSEIKLYTITNKNGMVAKLTNIGAILVSLLVPDKAGDIKDVVLGFDSGEEYYGNGSFFGATIGRSANRVADAKFSIDGVTYNLCVNDNANNLHSDKDNGFHKRIWSAETGENCVKFSLFSEDMDMGFPGNLNISVTYTLTDDNALELHYEGVCDKKSYLNMTNHTYFNLAGHDSGCMEDTILTINAKNYTPVVEGAIPTGEIASVEGTPMDFTAPKAIGKEIEADFEQLKLVQGYDHNYVLDNYTGEMRKIAEAEAAGRKMEVYTDLPGVQFYAGNCISPETGKGNAKYDKRHAFCLETQYYPNSINQEGFYKPEFDANEKYDTTTIYKFI